MFSIPAGLYHFLTKCPSCFQQRPFYYIKSEVGVFTLVIHSESATLNVEKVQNENNEGKNYFIIDGKLLLDSDDNHKYIRFISAKPKIIKLFMYDEHCTANKSRKEI